MVESPPGGGPRAIILDFDGVVLESADIKAEGILRLFEGWPEHRDAIHRHLVDNAGLSRQAKIAHVRHAILRDPLAPGELEALSATYAAHVREAMMACPMAPGTAGFLARARGRAPLFIASGTPEDELRGLVKARGLAPFFAGVYGSPPLKHEICLRILGEHRLQPVEALFVGDSMTDYHAALAVGMPFVGRVRPGEDTFRGLGVPTVPDLRGLLPLLSG